MIITPTTLHNLTTKELNALKEFMSGNNVGVFKKFARDNIDSLTQLIVNTAFHKDEVNLLRYRQGMIKVHQLYEALSELIELEIKRRGDLPIDS